MIAEHSCVVLTEPLPAAGFEAGDVGVVIPDMVPPKGPFGSGGRGRARDDQRVGIARLDLKIGPAQQFGIGGRIDLARRPFAVNIRLIPDLDAVGALSGHIAYKRRKRVEVRAA